MKLFKLIKAIDYVTYPLYKELIKISKAVSNSLADFRTVLFSSIVGVLLEITPLSDCLIDRIKGKKLVGIIEKLVNYEHISLVVSIVIAIVLCLILYLLRFLHTRWSSNKNTDSKRDILVYEFYNVAIPQLIEVKSILEQMHDDTSGEERKKLLLLLQAKHEICNLYKLLFEMRVIERKKTGSQTDSSRKLYDRISKSAYSTFLIEMLETLLVIYTELSKSQEANIQEEIMDIRAIIYKTGVFDQVNEIKKRLTEIQNIVRTE